MYDFLFYAVDPGAMSIMLPVWELAKAKDIKVGWLVDGYAKSYFKKQGNKTVTEIDDFIEQSRGGEKIIFGSQCKTTRTAALLNKANKKGIKTYFLLDHWCNYEKHFIFKKERIYPSEFILVMDKIAKEEMLKLSIPCEKIRIVGHPAIEKTIQSYKNGKHEVKKYQVLFLSEPTEQDYGYGENGRPALGYTQYSALRFLLRSIPALKNASKINLIIKPHPREHVGKLRNILREYQHRLNISINNWDEATELIFNSEYVFGLTTVLLLHSFAIGKKTGSIQINRNALGRKKSNPYFEKMLVLNRQGFRHILNNKASNTLQFPGNSAQSILNILLKEKC